MRNSATLNTPIGSDGVYQPATSFIGLAPFLRMSIAGTDFTSVAEEMLIKAERYPDDAELWMNLSTVMMCLKQLKAGLAIQEQALAMQRVFHLRASRQPARLRLLMLMMPGDLSANMPLDCLLENSDIDLLYYYITPNTPLAWPVPEHDAVLVAISAADESREPLAQLEQALAHWPKPVINAPQFIPASERHQASMLLQNVPGLSICPALPVESTALQRVAIGEIPLSAAVGGHHFPIILRPVGSHGGRGLARIDTLPAVTAYLNDIPAEKYFLSRFVDYSGQDGLFRKFRIVLIAGMPYACHMAISSHWMIHYVNAGMYEDEKKRAEEAAFFTHFDAFVQRHRGALAAIYQRTHLDYIGIDCAETRDGDLLVFEIDPAMVVHAMDQEDIFPHKQYHMQKVKDALRELLLLRAAENPLNQPL